MDTNTTPTHRMCTDCGEEKRLEEFHKKPSGRYGRRSQCIECARSYMSKRQKQRRSENPERERARDRQDYRTNIEKRKISSQKFKQANPLKVAHWGRRQRARRKGATTIDLTFEEWMSTVEYFGGRCAYCNCEMRDDGQDHIVPFWSGGQHTVDNVVPSCNTCNFSKQRRSLVEWMLKSEEVRT